MSFLHTNHHFLNFNSWSCSHILYFDFHSFLRELYGIVNTVRWHMLQLKLRWFSNPGLWKVTCLTWCKSSYPTNSQIGKQIKRKNVRFLAAVYITSCHVSWDDTVNWADRFLQKLSQLLSMFWQLIKTNNKNKKSCKNCKFSRLYFNFIPWKSNQDVPQIQHAWPPHSSFALPRPSQSGWPWLAQPANT